MLARSAPSKLLQVLPWGPVLLACLINLWILRSETLGVPNFNDSSLHLAMIRWARYQMDQGQVPLSGWYPHLSTGLPLFTHYQSLAHLLAALLSYPFGVDAVFQWSLYLLLALWPLSVYWGARLLGWDSWTGAVAALVAPVMVSINGYGFESGSFTWWGLGMWSQLWGMWVLPLVLGLTWRAVNRKGSPVLAALSLSLLLCLHFLTGYLAFAALATWVLAGPPRQLLGRLGRAALVGAGAMGGAAWVVVPVLAGLPWHVTTEFMRNTFWVDSYPLIKSLGWLIHGDLFDHARLPVVTVAAAIGLATCLGSVRRDARAQALLGFLAVSAFLYSGRATFGSLMDYLPGTHDLFMHRYLMGVQLAAIWMAGVGLVSVSRFAIARLTALRPTLDSRLVALACGLLIAIGLTPAWQQVVRFRTLDDAAKTYQVAIDQAQLGDFQSLIGIARVRGGGRIYAGSSDNWGRDWKVGYVPVYNILENEDAEALGFLLRTPALMTDAEASFDPGVLAQYGLFNVRYLLLPPTLQPVVKSTFVAGLPSATLWEVQTSGYVGVVDTTGPPWVGNRDTVGATTRRLLASTLPAHSQYPVVKFPSTPEGVPTSVVTLAATPGAVSSENDQPLDGIFRATVHLDRPGAVILKASYDPGWTAEVDGQSLKPYMVAPAYPAVNLAAGTHTITWRYRSGFFYPGLIAFSILSLACLAVNRRRLGQLRTVLPGSRARPVALLERVAEPHAEVAEAPAEVVRPPAEVAAPAADVAEPAADPAEPGAEVAEPLQPVRPGVSAILFGIDTPEGGDPARILDLMTALEEQAASIFVEGDLTYPAGAAELLVVAPGRTPADLRAAFMRMRNEFAPLAEVRAALLTLDGAPRDSLPRFQAALAVCRAAHRDFVDGSNLPALIE